MPRSCVKNSTSSWIGAARTIAAHHPISPVGGPHYHHPHPHQPRHKPRTRLAPHRFVASIKILGRVRAYLNWGSFAGGRERLGGVAAPVGDLFHAFAPGVFEKSDFVAGVFVIVGVSPPLRLPRPLVGCGLAATGTAGVKGDARLRSSRHVLQFDEDTAHFFDLFVGTQNVLVAQQVSRTEFAGFAFRLLPGVERTVFGPQLLGRVAGHPKNVLVEHTLPQSRSERMKRRSFEALNYKAPN